MDIVYILGSGSTWQDNEIRYSLRSVEQNVKDLGNVFVVGEKPDWLQNIIHIACPDSYGIKWRNAYTKISLVCKNSELSDEFLLMNDDFFILKPIMASEYPYYFSSVLTQAGSIAKAKFLTTPEKLASHVSFYGKMVRNFSVHRPIRYDKNKFLAMPKLDLAMTGFSVRGFYGNYYGLPAIQCRDITLSPLMKETDYDKATDNRTDISIFSETARTASFQNWIKSKFPLPSRFEKV